VLGLGGGLIHDNAVVDPFIGGTYQGGLVFYLDGNGGGLIAGPTEIGVPLYDSGMAQWGCMGISISTGTAIGTGASNTANILYGCPGNTCCPNQGGNFTITAAEVCDDYTGGGYTDWFLPSKDELNKMYLNIGQGNALGLGNVGNFLDFYYFSSSEATNDLFWAQFYTTNAQYQVDKRANYWIRPIRAF